MVLAIMACTVVTGCGKKNEKAATQVIASVDGEEVSVSQMNAVLSKAAGISPERLPQAKQDILNGLVEQQLAINLAVSKKLDRTPEVVTAIENAKREILARAALEQMAAAQPKPTDEEAQQYFAANPPLFAQRRVYSLQEIAIRKSGHDITELRERAASVKTIEEMSAWLKEKGIEFTANGGTRSAEQIPLEVLPQLHAFKDGQIGLIEGKDAYLIMRVVASRSQPVTETQALPTIKVYLKNQRGAEAVKRGKETLKAKAKIEYFGEFAGGEAAFKAKALADAKAAEDAQTQAKAKAEADAQALLQKKAETQAAAQAEANARLASRAQARENASNSEKSSVQPVAIDLEKGMKGLK